MERKFPAIFLSIPTEAVRFAKNSKKMPLHLPLEISGNAHCNFWSDREHQTLLWLILLIFLIYVLLT